MAVAISIDLYCDECGDWTCGKPEDDTPERVRLRARAEGWRTEDKDRCPRCVEKTMREQHRLVVNA